MRFTYQNGLHFLLLWSMIVGCEQNNMPEASQKAILIEQVINEILQEYPDAFVAVSIRDLSDEFAFDYNGDTLLHAASTMKVPVMIEVFRQSEEGRFSMREDSIRVVNAFRSIVDGSPYSIEDDSDDAIYTRLGEFMSIEDLVYQMITVSSNLATNLLIDYASADAVQEAATNLGTKHMRVLRGVEDLKAFEKGLSNSATSSDLATLLAALARGEAVSPASDERMIEILAAQQFNEMIPAGLPEGMRVAHKTGVITRIHHDAAIVFPTSQSPYVLVILTRGLNDTAVSATLGARITTAVHSILHP